MSLIERVTGVFPVATERVKTAWKFASSGLGKTVISLVAVVVVLAWVHHRGEVRGAAPVADLQKQVATLKSQLAAANELAGAVKKDADQARSKALSSEAVARNLNQKVNDYVRELAKRKTPARCVATPDDVRSLQRIQ